MKKYNLGFISDADIYEHVKNTVKSYRREITLKDFNESIVDPIKLTFDSKVYGKSIRQSIADECFRQIDKSNGNKIGYFHQNLFNYAGNGWEVPKEGFDVENRDLHIYVEMKNKHNTMNSASSQKTYMKMQSCLLEDDGALLLKNTVYDELGKEHLDLLKALYLLAFSTYEGFSNMAKGNE